MSQTTNFFTRTCFAAGGSAAGLVNNGVAFFLLIFYSQVCGLSPSLAGLALLLALMVDAISDPVVGKLSDTCRSRFGRRHPFMYASILPIIGFYYALWVPPETGQAGLFAYLLFTSIGLRLSLTAFSIPFTALIPELTRDYDERTRLVNYNLSASWFAGTMMAVAMYAYWLADSTEYPNGMGILRAEGYAEAGLFAAGLILLLVALASLGTHRHIRQHSATTTGTYQGLGTMLKQIGETFSNGSFRALAISGIFNAAGAGTATALWAYMQPYFWGFDSEQISWMLTSQLLSAILAFTLVPLLARGREKKTVLILLSWLLILVSAGPIVLRLTGVFPENGTSELFYIMLVLGVLQVAMIAGSSIIVGSMLSDIVETRELASGRREEGTLLAVQSFINKGATGVGTFFGGIILAIIDFPDQTLGMAVAPEVITRLGLAYGPVLALLYIAAILALKHFRITRDSHAETLKALAQ